MPAIHPDTDLDRHVEADSGIDTETPPLAGVYPAMTTPFDATGAIDFERLRADARRLEAAGVAGLVPCGSTGESATLTHDEHIDVVEAVVEAVEDVPVIAGTGSNATHEAVSLSRRAVAAGADGLLLLSPYYNKPEPAGMLAHYRAIADAVEAPQIVYNVPSRTGRTIPLDVAVELAGHENVVGYKAASGDMGRISELIERTREERFAVLSGDDGMTYPIVAAGGTGVISVAANVYPERLVELVAAARAGELERARDLHHHLGPLFRVLFVETNPIPVKEAMAIRFDAPPHLRLPLTRLADERRGELESVIRRLDRTAPTA